MIYKKFSEIPFHNRAKETLKQIYAVLYHIEMGYEHTEAIRESVKYFPKVKDYQTIEDKCGRLFAGDINAFLDWYKSGTILTNLVLKKSIDEHDEDIFSKLLKNKQKY